MAETKRPPFNSSPDEPAPRWEHDLSRTARMDTRPRPVEPANATTLPLRSPPPLPTEDTRTGGVELVVVDESQLARGERKPWRAGEVWTKRRVYALDSTFTCVEILDRETGRLETGHELLGARLGGGRLREMDVVRLSYPLPLPGMEAMFLKGKRHGYTSAVERMIVRIRRLSISANEAVPSWDDIASRWSEPPPK